MAPSTSKYVWFDGRYVLAEKAQVPITTHAIHYGTSVFEGIRAYWNGKNLNVFRLDQHIKRFRRSGQFYNISLGYSDDEITDAVIGICKKNKIKKSCYIRPFYFVGDYGINLHVTQKAPTNVAILAFPSGICLTRTESVLGSHHGESSQTTPHHHRQRWVETI